MRSAFVSRLISIWIRMSRASSSWAFVNTRLVVAGLPDTKMSSPLFAPPDFHLG